MFRHALHHPHRLRIRRALFQVHLWLGVLLSVYVAVIGLSGSVLVFEDELRHLSLHGVSFDPARVATVDAALAQARGRFPGEPATYVSLPSPVDPRWSVYLSSGGGRTRRVYADAATGTPLDDGGRRPLLDVVRDLHVSLLAGHKGFVVNCACGIGLLVLALTGAVLWWPGIRRWRRGFWIALRGRWRRINYDAHNAVGIWTLLIVSWWGITSVYFLFPAGTAAVVNAVSRLEGMKPPATPKVIAHGTSSVPMQTIVDNARRVSPGFVSGMSLPGRPGGNVSVDVQRTPGDFTHRDDDVFDSSTGRLLSQWHYGNNRTAGDWIVWLMYPLHFGTLWGMGVKVLWAVLGLSLPVLSTTGLLMYWNRFLRTRWRALRERPS